MREVLRRVEESKEIGRGKTLSVDLRNTDFRYRLTQLNGLINSCRRTSSLSPKPTRPICLPTAPLPKHLLYKDIHKILKDDWNKTRKLTQQLLLQTYR